MRSLLVGYRACDPRTHMTLLTTVLLLIGRLASLKTN